MLKNIRAFFDARDVLEVETPLLSQFCTTDPHLDSLRSSFRGQTCYLNTSPEYAMKRLLVECSQPIYQICKAFRDDELGPAHNPEFSLLEWYRPGFDMFQLMAELVELVQLVVTDINRESQYYSYQQAFELYAGINPHRVTAAQCLQLAVEKNIEIPQGLTASDTVDEWLDWLLMQLVLPAFNKKGFTCLYDYPATQSSLARVVKEDRPWPVAKRFELFFGEIELANGFFELADAGEQLQRFENENVIRRQQGKATGRIDMNFITALRSGLPDCSGVALGLDRLLMVKQSCRNISEVLPFPWGDA